MTKKSDGRIERDKNEAAVEREIENGTTWDDLKQQHAQAVAALLLPGTAAARLNDPEILKYIQDHNSFQANVAIVQRDVMEFHKDLQHIYLQHEGMSGKATRENILNALAIGEQYMAFMIRYRSVIHPTLQHILEATNQAEHLAIRAKLVAEQEAAAVTQVH